MRYQTLGQTRFPWRARGSAEPIDRRQYLFVIKLNLSCKQIPSSPNSAVVCRCQTFAHLSCPSARNSTARVSSVSISSFFAHLHSSTTIIRMMTTITIMSSFPNRFDHDEDYLFGQPSLAACILASIFLSDTSFTTTSFCNMHLWNIVLTCAEE